MSDPRMAALLSTMAATPEVYIEVNHYASTHKNPDLGLSRDLGQNKSRTPNPQWFTWIDHPNLHDGYACIPVGMRESISNACITVSYWIMASQLSMTRVSGLMDTTPLIVCANNLSRPMENHQTQTVRVMRMRGLITPLIAVTPHPTNNLPMPHHCVTTVVVEEEVVEVMTTEEGKNPPLTQNKELHPSTTVIN
jgi:hypothetical protein